MRWLIPILCGLLSVVLLGSFFTLYFWVPRFKAHVLGMGTALPGWQVVLITLSDLIINYIYLVLPAVLAVCYGLCRVAFASDNESPRTES